MNEASFFAAEVEGALAILRSGGIILYPTDTTWGLGCNALDEKAVDRIYTIKQRPDSKSLVLLLAGFQDILHYIAAPDPEALIFIEEQELPTTVIFDGAIDLPNNVVAADGSVAIRIVQDPFCRHLVKRLGAPLVSTSANISAEPTAQIFSKVSWEIKSAVDHIVRWRQDDERASLPSQLVRWQAGEPVFLRK